MKSKIARKTLNIVGNVLMYLFFAVCLAMLIVTVTARKNKDGTPIVFGHEVRLVLTNSMEKCDQTDVSGYKVKDLPVHSAVFVEVVPTDPNKAAEWYAALRVGDVLTFKYVYVEQETITHRLVKIEPKEGGGYLLTMEGDNKSADGDVLQQVIDTSQTESFNYVIGKVTGKSLVLGYLIYALDQPVGIVCIVIVPCVIIIILEIIRIVDAANKKKKKKLDEESSQKENELEMLRRRVAELEKSNASADNNSENAPDNTEDKSANVSDSTVEDMQVTIGNDPLETKEEIQAKENKTNNT